MLLLGILSMLLGIAATPAVICVLFPLVTTAEFGDSIPTDSGGVFVMASTPFVAIYKLLDACWGWFGERCETSNAAIAWMFAIVVAISVVSWLTLSLCSEDDSQTEAVDPPTVVESTDDCYTDVNGARGVNRYAVALLRGTANAGDLDKYDHCKYLSAIVPPGESE